MANTLQEALNQVEQTRGAIVKLSKTKPEGWKKEYAMLRPRLQDDLSELARVGSLSADDGTLTSMVKEAKSLVQQHQARWPVLIIDSTNETYLASAKAIDDLFLKIAAQVRKTN